MIPILRFSYVFKYMGVYKVWCLHFGMGEVHNTFHKYWHNMLFSSGTHPIAIPIQRRIQRSQLNDIGIMELEYL